MDISMTCTTIRSHCPNAMKSLEKNRTILLPQRKVAICAEITFFIYFSGSGGGGGGTPDPNGRQFTPGGHKSQKFQKNIFV